MGKTKKFNKINYGLTSKGGYSVANFKHKRSNYLIDKSFQLGFITKFIVIVVLTILCAFSLTAGYYWIVSSVGEYKLDTAVTLIKRGQITYKGKPVYNYDKEKIRIYEDFDESGKKIYKCFQTYPTSKTLYEPGDTVNNVDESATEPYIGAIKTQTSLFSIVFFPLLFTGLALILIISIFSLFFSHRMAGPIYRMRVSLDRMLTGDLDFVIRVRKNDFFQNIVERLEKFRKQVVHEDPKKIDDK